MRTLFFVIAAFLLIAPCHAQTVTQSGTVTAGNPACWVGTGPSVSGATATCPSTPPVTVQCSGDPTATVKDDALIQAAIHTSATGPAAVHILGATATSVAPGTCAITKSITIYTPGQYIFGDGQTQTTLTVSSVAAIGSGVFIASTGEPGPRVEDLGITVIQPNVSSRGTALQTVTAFYFQNTPRFQLHRIRLVD